MQRFTLSLIVLFLTTASLSSRTISEIYNVIASPYSYVPVSQSNSSTLVDLKQYTSTYPSSPLYGNYDDGIILLGNFGNSQVINFAFPFNLNEENQNVLAHAVSTNGMFQPIRTRSSGGGVVTVNSFPYPSSAGYWGNSQTWNAIFGFGGDLDLSNDTTSKWYYAVQGSAPNRRIVFEWRNAKIYGTSTRVTFQIILNESDKSIDFVFGGVNGPMPSNMTFYTGVNEGTAALSNYNIPEKDSHGDPGNYIACKFENGSWTYSSSVSNPYGTIGTFPTENIRFCIAPILNVSAPPTTLFNAATNTNDRISVGTTLTKTYTITNQNSSNAPLKITTEISGPGAGSYSVTPAQVAALQPGSSQQFQVTFSGNAFGPRNAQLIFRLSSIDGASCPEFLDPVSVGLQGRVLGLDAVIDPLELDFGQVAVNATTDREFALFWNESSQTLRYRFYDLQGGEFQLLGATGVPPEIVGTVAPGDTVKLPIRFHPSSIGQQQATVRFQYSNVQQTVFSDEYLVTVRGEGTPTRLKFAIGDNDEHAPSGSVLGQQREAVVGEQPADFPFTISNTGIGGNVRLWNFHFVALDVDNPVGGRFRVLWTHGFGQGEPVSLNRHFRLQAWNGTAWEMVDPAVGVTVKPGESLQMRVLFAPHRRGVYFARMFFQTDATADHNYNAIEALNEADQLTAGLQSYDLYGLRARNSRLERLKRVEFPPTKIGHSAEVAVPIVNTGDARLLIDQSRVRLLPGDPDFEIVSAFPQKPIDNGNYVIAVGDTGYIYIRFTPQAIGARYSRLELYCNDSTNAESTRGRRSAFIFGEAVGVPVLDVQLAGSDTVLFAQDTVVVGDPTTYKTASVQLVNTGSETLEITDILLSGANADDYQLAYRTWRKDPEPQGDLPWLLEPGDQRTVTVSFMPQTPGHKSAAVQIRSNAENGAVLEIPLGGFAGVRTIAAAVDTLFLTDSVVIQETITRTVAILNTGTVPVQILNATIQDDANRSYAVNFSDPVTIPPSESYDLEVRFTGKELGPQPATLVVESNATDAAQLHIALAGYVGYRLLRSISPLIKVTRHITPGGLQGSEGCVDLQNLGDISLRILSVAIYGDQLGEFEILEYPEVLMPNQKAPLCIRYTPKSEQFPTAFVEIEDNDPRSVNLTIPINIIVTGIAKQPHQNRGITATLYDENRVLSIDLALTHPQPVQIRITDLAGKVLFQAKETNPVTRLRLQVPAERWSSGLYVLHVQGVDGQLTQLFSIVR